jgi:hypothetical protein
MHTVSTLWVLWLVHAWLLVLQSACRCPASPVAKADDVIALWHLLCLLLTTVRLSMSVSLTQTVWHQKEYMWVSRSQTGAGTKESAHLLTPVLLFCRLLGAAGGPQRPSQYAWTHLLHVCSWFGSAVALSVTVVLLLPQAASCCCCWSPSGGPLPHQLGLQGAE